MCLIEICLHVHLQILPFYLTIYVLSKKWPCDKLWLYIIITSYSLLLSVECNSSDTISVLQYMTASSTIVAQPQACFAYSELVNVIAIDSPRPLFQPLPVFMHEIVPPSWYIKCVMIQISYPS